MISAIDQALAALLRRDALRNTEVDVAFEPPTRDWAAGRSAPTVNVYLYDIREDERRRSRGQVDVRDSDGRIISRRATPRYFVLSYLLTAWTTRTQDEHQLLAAMLNCVLAQDALPVDLLPEPVRAGGPVGLALGAPDRVSPDLWSALGGTLKPSLDVAVSVPVLPGAIPVGPLVREPALVALRELT